MFLRLTFAAAALLAAPAVALASPQNATRFDAPVAHTDLDLVTGEDYWLARTAQELPLRRPRPRSALPLPARGRGRRVSPPTPLHRPPPLPAYDVPGGGVCPPLRPFAIPVPALEGLAMSNANSAIEFGQQGDM